MRVHELGEHFLRDGVRWRNLETGELDRFRVDIRRLRPPLKGEAEQRAQCRAAAEFERVEGERVLVVDWMLARAGSPAAGRDRRPVPQGG